MTANLRFDPIRLPPECEALRREVRAFLAEEVAAGTFDPNQPRYGDLHDRAFSRRVGARGWIGMTWPKKYGGHERSFLERYVVTEEFRVANAPARLHFVADRQSGPILLKYAPEEYYSSYISEDFGALAADCDLKPVRNVKAFVFKGDGV